MLDQTIALPSDSYMIDYFDTFTKYFAVGPPLFFVVRGVNFSTVQGQYAVASKLWKDVNPYSIGAELEVNRQESHAYIAQSTSIWLDDFYLFTYNCYVSVLIQLMNCYVSVLIQLIDLI